MDKAHCSVGDSELRQLPLWNREVDSTSDGRMGIHFCKRAKKWDKYRSGFFSPKNQQSENESFSDESVSRISWSSPSSSDSDLHLSEKPPRLNYLQNHRVVTRLNFDDCVTTKYKTPRKKRAKVSRLFVKREQSEPHVDIENQGKGSTAMNSEIPPVAIVKNFSVGPNVDMVKNNRNHTSPQSDNDCHIQEESVCALQNDSHMSMVHTLEKSNEHYESNKETTENDGIYSSPGCPRSTSGSVKNGEHDPQYARSHTMSPVVKCSGALQNDCGSPVLGIMSGRVSKDCAKETTVHMPLERESKDETSTTKNYKLDNSYQSPEHEESLLDISVSILSKVPSHKQKQSLVIPDKEKHDIIMKENSYSASEGVQNAYNGYVESTVRSSQSPVLSVEATVNSRRKRMRRCSEGASVGHLVKLPVSPVLKTKELSVEAKANSQRKHMRCCSEDESLGQLVKLPVSPVLKTKALSVEAKDNSQIKHMRRCSEDESVGQLVKLPVSPVLKTKALSVEAKANSQRKRMRCCSEGMSEGQLVKLPVSPILKTKAITTSRRKCQRYYSQKGIEETVGPSQSPVLKRERKALCRREFKRWNCSKKAKKNADASLHLSHRPSLLTLEEESSTSDKNNVCKLVSSDLKLGMNTNDKMLSQKCEIYGVQSENTLQLKTVPTDSINFLKSVQPQLSVHSECKDGDTLPDRHCHTEINLSTIPQEYLPPPGSNSIQYTQKLEHNNFQNSPLISTHLVSLPTEDSDGTCVDDENSSTGIQLVHNEDSNSEQSESLQISFLSQNNSNFARESSVMQTDSKIFRHLDSTFVNSRHDFSVAYNENCSQNVTADISFSTQDPDSKCHTLKSENSIKLLAICNRSSETISSKLCPSKQGVKKPAKCKQIKPLVNLQCIGTVMKKETEDESYQAICNQQFPCSFVSIEHMSSQEESERSSQNMKDSQIISQLSSPTKKTKSHVSSPDSVLVNDIIPMGLGAFKQTSEVKNSMDSARKRKRLKKNGLASRLQQLLARRKSSIRMWQYQQCLEENRHAKYRAVQFFVIAAWTELGHTIIRCRRHLQSPDSRTHESHEDRKVSSQEEFTNADVIVVLDGGQAITAHMRPGSVIQIFPPWQVLKVQRLNISILMCMSHFEVISVRPEKNIDAIQSAPKEVLVNQEEFTCHCLTGAQNGGQLCQFRLPRNIFRIFFNEGGQENEKREISFSGGASSNSKGTISEALAGSSFLVSGGIELCITVVGVFCYRHPTHNTIESDNDNKTNVIWSVLGFDRAKEYCEVVLGCSPCLKFDISLKERHKKQQWEDFIQGRAIGKVYRFTGLIMVNKVLRKKSSGLWTFLHVKKTPSFCKLFCKTNGWTPELTLRFETDANTNEDESLDIDTQTNNQSILYTFSPLSEEWSCTSIETRTISLLVDSFQYITDILRQVTDDMQERCSAIVKLIYIHENLFYCTDSSLNVANCAGDRSSYVIIKVLSSCVAPHEPLKGSVTVLCFLNILLSEGKLTADKYTRILTVPGKDSDAPVFGLPFKFPVDFLETVTSQKALIQNFTEMSKVLDLVKVSGSVVGVDEETAFSWPTCEICGSEFLSEVDGGGFFCERCNQETETITSMSLEVYISCVEVSEDSKVKIKLLQQSIANLLPPEPSGSEGYDVLSVLGKYIGPITCLVVKVNEVHSVKSYYLDEVLLFENS